MCHMLSWISLAKCNQIHWFTQAEILPWTNSHWALLLPVNFKDAWRNYRKHYKKAVTIHQYPLTCSLSLKFIAWVVKLSFLLFSLHMHTTFTGTPLVRSMRQICNGICEEIQLLHLMIHPPDCCQEIHLLPFNLRMSQHTPRYSPIFCIPLTELEPRLHSF